MTHPEHGPRAAVEAERARILDIWQKTSAEHIHMMLANGLPGGTSHQRAKRKAYVEGVGFAVDALKRAIEGS